MPESQNVTVRALLSPKALAKQLGVHPETLFNWVRDRGFPRPIHFSSRLLRYDVEAVNRWLAEQSGGGGHAA
jgi:predicted DNA-binding transcriptional regulator AlpA